jgi:hypothetical protein
MMEVTARATEMFTTFEEIEGRTAGTNSSIAEKEETAFPLL